MEHSTTTKESPESKGKSIVTQPDDIALNNLKESDIGKPICVKVYQKWTPTNKQGRPVIFCFMLIDQQV